jgi:hypothetical protein
MVALLAGAYPFSSNGQLIELEAELPPATIIDDLCKQIENPKSRALILSETAGTEDMNNDGVPEIAKSCWGGTMNGPCVTYFNQSGKEIAIEQMGFEWKDYWTYGAATFRHQGHTFFLNTKDDNLRKPSYVSYITPANREYVVCEFVNTIETTLNTRKGATPSVCSAILKNSPMAQEINIKELGYPPYADLDKAERPTPGAAFVIENLYPPELLAELRLIDEIIVGRSETHVTAAGRIDIDNDGHPELVAELEFSSGGGRGCDFNYFEIIHVNAAKPAIARKRKQFLKMQGIENAGYGGRSCGNIKNRLFTFKGKTYYEKNITNNALEKRQVAILDSGGARTICTFGRAIHTRVK